MKCENIREVWDYRLSTACPTIDRSSGYWVVKIYSKTNPDYDPENPSTLALPLEEFDTGIEYELGDEYDVEKLTVCYEWLLSVRDNYAYDDIEKMKPIVAKINEENAKLAELGKA